jgi:DNA polymerase-3 subunit delta
MFYLVQGDDEYRVEMKRDELQSEFLRTADAAVETLDGKDRDVNLTTLFQAVSTQSFFEPRKIVLLDNAGDFLDREKEYLSKGSGLEILSDMLKVGDDVLIILTAYDKLVNKNTKVFKLISEKGRVIELKKLWHDPNEGLTGQLQQWAKGECKKRNLNLTDQQLNLIVTRVGSDLRQIANELDKIGIYLNSDTASSLTNDRIDELVPANRELVVFNLVDAVAQKNVRRAVSFIHDLISSGASESYIITMLHRQMRQIYAWQLLEKQGMDANSRTAQLGLTDYTRRKLLAQTSNFPPKTLPGMISALIVADQEVKSSSMPANVVLEKLVVRLTGKRGISAER